MLGTVKDLSIVTAGLVAFVTLWTGMAQWARAQHAARADQFVAMRRRFLEDPTFRRLLDLLAAGDDAISRESVQDRRNLAGFLEEIGLLVNSGLLLPSRAVHVRALRHARGSFGWILARARP